MQVIAFYDAMRTYFSGFVLQGVNRKWRQSSIFYLTATLCKMWRVFAS